ncbi:hypothetical protein LCGC14_2532730, partial [marine sediment metagenome]
MREVAERIRDDLIDTGGITLVNLMGVRDYEISVEVSEENLRRYGISFEQVAKAIRTGSIDLPGGTIKTSHGEILIRSKGQLYTGREFEEIPLITLQDGTSVRLKEVTTVNDGFEDVEIKTQFNGKPAALVSVFKTGDEDTIAITKAVRKYVKEKQRELPAGIVLEPWADFSRMISDRLDMLVRNGLQGLVLVMLVLWLFLGLRMSFWVAMGIPVSLMGTILVLHLTGMSLNMMSMFALIMAIGLIVDDAIVVGENVYAHVQDGLEPSAAAVRGTHAVLLPVVGAVTTTWIAFGPLAMMPGVMGRFIKILPYCVAIALAFSLLECLLILPPHLAHTLLRRQKLRERPAGRVRRWAERVRRRIDSAISRLINVYFAGVYRKITRYRYVTAAVLVAILITVIGAIRTGWVSFTIFPKLDSDSLRAKVGL